MSTTTKLLVAVIEDPSALPSYTMGATVDPNAVGLSDKRRTKIEALLLKSYDQKREAFQGTEQDVILLDEEPPRGVIALPEGSWGEGGYHYVWLNDGNYWTWEKLYPAERKMRAMARDYASGPAREIVDQCARELLLAEASDWQFLISTYAARDYAEVRFQDHIDRFNRLASFAERVHGGGELTDEETAFFNDCKLKDAAFQEINLSYWERLDRPLNERTAVAGT